MWGFVLVLGEPPPSQEGHTEMTYEVLQVVGLPVMEERVVHRMSTGEEIKDWLATGKTIRKEPGSTISDEEFQEARQSEEAIQHLLDIGAIQDPDNPYVADEQEEQDAPPDE